LWAEIDRLTAELGEIRAYLSFTVFVTSQAFDGNLGGLAGADQKCNDAAAAAGLFGTYKAWLSDDTGSPSTRFTQSDRPYALVDGTVVADDWADLTDGALQNRINLDEHGAVIAPLSYSGWPLVWTATQVDGSLWAPYAAAWSSCSNWTTASDLRGGYWGRADVANSDWTEAALSYHLCHLVHYLYCVEQ
jgi:hypothetical protein